MNKDNYYYVDLQNCKSNIKNIFKMVFGFPKPNMIKFCLNTVTFSLEEWQMFTTLKWKNLQNINLSFKYVIKIIQKWMIHAVSNSSNVILQN